MVAEYEEKLREASCFGDIDGVKVEWRTNFFFLNSAWFLVLFFLDKMTEIACKTGNLSRIL